MRPRLFSRGFTLVEICIVAFILAFLMALLLPVLVAARMSAKQTVAISNLRQLGLSVAMYRQDFESAGSSSLPDYTLIYYFSAPTIFGRQTKDLWMSPCGTHPQTEFMVPKGQTNLFYMGSTQEEELFVSAYQKFGESTAYLFDVNCNSHDKAVVDGEFIRKTVLGLLLDGSVHRKQKIGVPYDPLTW